MNDINNDTIMDFLFPRINFIIFATLYFVFVFVLISCFLIFFYLFHISLPFISYKINCVRTVVTDDYLFNKFS